jgi:prevent-host-death family protein
MEAAMATQRRQVTTMTSREFNQQTSRAKSAADAGPVVVTDRGEPAYVLLNYADYAKLETPRKFVSAAEALADPNARPGDPDLMDFIPKRTLGRPPIKFDRRRG